MSKRGKVRKAERRELREAESQMCDEVWDHLLGHFANEWCGDEEEHGSLSGCLGSVIQELAKDYHETQLTDIKNMVDEAYEMLEEISERVRNLARPRTRSRMAVDNEPPF